MTTSSPSGPLSLPEPGSLSRREVLKSAMLAAPVLAGLPDAASLAGMRDAARPANPTLRIGLIGCGGRGRGAAIQALRADPDTVLVAMGDVFADRLQDSLSGIGKELGEQASQRLQVPPERQFIGFDAYQKVIDSGVDVVILTTYPCFRPAHLKAAIEAGKHVFAEKPVAVDAPGVRSVLESAALAKRKNLALTVGFCWRFHPGMREAFAKLHEGALGRIATVYTNYHTGSIGKRPRKSEWSDLEFQMRNWWHFTWISGDHIVEQAVHSIDRMAWAMQDKLPTRVTCLGGRAARSGPEHGNVFDHFSAIYEYDDGRRAYHTCCQIDGFPGDNKDYVYGSKGLATIDSWNARFPFKSHAGEEIWTGVGKPEDAGEMYQVEHNELFASIRSGKPMNNGVEGANSTLLAVMARMGAYTGKAITWEQAMNSKESLVPETLQWGPFATPEVAIPGRTKFT